MAVAVDLVWDAENGADAAAMTTTIMDAGTHLSGAIGAWGVVGASPNFAVSTSGQKGHGTRAFSVSGTPYTDSAGTRGMRQDHSAQGGIAKYFQFVKSVGTAKVSASVWFNTGIAYQGFESYTVFGLIDGGFTGGAMFNLQTFGAGSHETYIENVSSATLQGPSLSLNTWYLSSLLYDKVKQPRQARDLRHVLRASWLDDSARAHLGHSRRLHAISRRLLRRQLPLAPSVQLLRRPRGRCERRDLSAAAHRFGSGRTNPPAIQLQLVEQMSFKSSPIFKTGTGTNAGDIVIEITKNAEDYDTWQLGSSAGSMQVFGSLDGTNYLVTALALVDLTSVAPGTTVTSTTAGGNYGLKGRWKKIKLTQNGATAVAGAVLEGYQA
jgi:hypothetical protein